MAFSNIPLGELLQAALAGYGRQRAVLEERIAEIRQELASRGEHPGEARQGIPRRGMSAEGRARVAAAQRKRWAALKKGSDRPAKIKRKLSAATIALSGMRAGKELNTNTNVWLVRAR